MVHARVHATAEAPDAPGGIDAIHVVASDEDAAACMTGHVRSALLAGLATPVVPARIHVRTDAGRTEHPRGEPRVGAPEPRDRVRLIHAAEASRRPAVDEIASEPTVDAPAAPLARPGVHAQARLVAVDIQKPGDGRVLCRVSIAWNSYVYRAEAIAMDLPGAAAQAAAQAAVRAMVGAGVHGIELNGLREVEIAGRDYVLVALRRTEGRTVRLRSGSALMVGTPERSAAEATLSAANDLL